MSYHLLHLLKTGGGQLNQTFEVKQMPDVAGFMNSDLAGTRDRLAVALLHFEFICLHFAASEFLHPEHLETAEMQFTLSCHHLVIQTMHKNFGYFLLFAK